MDTIATIVIVGMFIIFTPLLIWAMVRSAQYNEEKQKRQERIARALEKMEKKGRNKK